MRAIEYGVAMSLDGYIAGPNGEYDWIMNDPEVDVALAETWDRCDTLLMGRVTWRVAVERMGAKAFAGKDVVVASRTLKPTAGARVVAELDPAAIRELKARKGGDIWLMGGGLLFRHLLAMQAVDRISLGIVPVLLGGGVSLLPAPPLRTSLRLCKHRVYASGIVMTDYDVVYSTGDAAPETPAL